MVKFPLEFFSAHGVRLECTTDGQMYEQVEYEAVPDRKLTSFISSFSCLNLGPGLDWNGLMFKCQ